MTPLYEQLLGESWKSLPEALRRAHGGTTVMRLRGVFDLQVGAPLGARLLQRLLGLPRRPGSVPATLEVRPAPDGEVWRREIGTWRLTTVLRLCRGRLCEQVGPLEFELELELADLCLRYRQRGLRLRVPGGRIPVPDAVALRVEATEQEADDPNMMQVSVRLTAPHGGLLLAYSGTLQVEG